MKRFLAAVAFSITILLSSASFSNHEYIVTPIAGDTESIRSFCINIDIHDQLVKAYKQGNDEGNQLFNAYLQQGLCLLTPQPVEATYVKKDRTFYIPSGTLEVWEFKIEGFGRPVWAALYVYRTPHDVQAV